MKSVVAFLLSFLIHMLAFAQSLPSLVVSSASKNTVQIHWPATNTAFILQESGTLAVPNWQGSALAPLFDSNRAAFFVSAPAPNATGFYRLAAPTDLRGIYVYAPLGGEPNNPADAMVTNAINVPGLDGLLIVGLWSDLETNYNQYDWSHLDKWMNYAAARNKKVTLAIRAGDGIPDWLYLPPPGGAGATRLDFTISPKDGKTTNCQPATIVIPWEAAFQTNWNAMLDHMAAHLKAQGTYSNLTLLRLTGINRTSDELRLPAETPYTNNVNGTGLPCVSDAPAIWQRNGYTPAKLLSAWSNIVASFNANFPDKTFCAAIIPNPPQLPFPPIDDNGDLIPITNPIPDQNQPLLQLASRLIPGRFVVQFNFLMTSNTANPAVSAAAASYGILTAFQVNNWYGSSGAASSACGGTVNQPTPCDDASYLDMLQRGIYPLGQTNPLRSQYIEVWATNAVAFTNAIWQAHLELFSGP